MYEYNAEVIRVIDGDTIVANVDLGCSVWVKKTIRLFGIDTPETRTRDLNEKALGLAAKERLVEVIENADYTIIVKSHGIGKFGRMLGTIYVVDESGKLNVNQALLIEGHAKEYKK